MYHPLHLCGQTALPNSTRASILRATAYLTCLGLLLSHILACTTSAEAATAAPPPPAEQPLILLELFTSQGCSSCPPADALLAKLMTEAKGGDLPIVALSYHVDYWNRLGWTDPYSQAAFSERQRSYARKLSDSRIYTPQLIVHGRSGHVGSREQEIRAAIRSVPPQRPPINIRIEETGTADSVHTLTYHLEGRTDNLILNLALVEGVVHNEVPRGENRGRQLEHVQLVRELQQIPHPPKQGSIPLDRSHLARPEEGQLVVFVQDADTWAVRGVTVWKK